MVAELRKLSSTIDELRLQLAALQDENAELRRQLAGGAAARRRPISAPPREPVRDVHDGDRLQPYPGDHPSERPEDPDALYAQDMAAADAAGHGGDMTMRDALTKRPTDPACPATPEKENQKHRRSDAAGGGRHD